MTVMTLALVQKQPAALRVVIGKHLAEPRWHDTC
ncbi:replication protein B, partial [Escherichia coli]|nr:replication protein B [Escherichia coli]